MSGECSNAADARATRLCCVRSGIGSARHERGTPLHTSRVSQSLTRRPVRSAQKLRALLHTRTYVYIPITAFASHRVSSRLIASHRIAACELAGRRIASDGSGAVCCASGRGTGSAEQREGREKRSGAARCAGRLGKSQSPAGRDRTVRVRVSTRLDSDATRRAAYCAYVPVPPSCRSRARICCVRRAIRRDNDADVCAHAMHSCVLALPLARAAGDAAPPKREQSRAKPEPEARRPNQKTRAHCTALHRPAAIHYTTEQHTGQSAVRSIHYIQYL